MFNDFYQEVKNDLKQSQLPLLVPKTALANLLAQAEVPSPWTFFNVYFASWWWNRLSFWSGLQSQSVLSYFNKVVRSLNYLRHAGIFNALNTNIVANHGCDREWSEILFALHQNGSLTQEIFSMVAAHRKPSRLVHAFLILSLSKGISNQENRALVAKRAEPVDLACQFVNLHGAGILTEKNRAVVAKHDGPKDLTAALIHLHGAGILTGKNRAVVARHNSPKDLSAALIDLHGAGILTEKNRAVFAKHVRPRGLDSALCNLQKAGILTKKNRAIVIKHPYPKDISTALSILQRGLILTPDNRGLVSAHARPHDLVIALSVLLRAQILNQENFNELVAPGHEALLAEESRALIWHTIPRHLLTQENYHRLLRAVEQLNPMLELRRVINQIMVREEGAEATFNRGQSTHTASVHRSVSVSAVRLMTRYGHDLNLEDQMQALKDYVYGLDDNPNHQAAKRCITRMAEIDYAFADRSGISILQLLALAYAAIHDDAKRLGSLEDAKALFLEGLYEIQRGYNLNAQGHDQGGIDAPICSSGTFNKLMEKLNGIHQDVEVYYITHEGASAKCARLAKAHAIAYLETQALSFTVAVKRLLEFLKADKSLEPIWDKIKARVEAELWDEFQSAYGQNRSHPQFVALINNGQYIDIPDFSAVETKLQTSEARLNLERYSLWANRQFNPEAQKDFDKQYGLILK